MSEPLLRILPSLVPGQRSGGSADSYFSGRSRGFGDSKISGTVTLAQSGQGVQRWVHLFMEQYWRVRGNRERAPLWHIQSVRSDPVTGYYEFLELDPNIYYTIVSFDSTGLYHPIIKGGLVPDDGETPVDLDFKVPDIGEFSDDEPAMPVFPVFNLVAFIGEGIPGYGEGSIRLNLTSAGEETKSKLVYLFHEEPTWRHPPKTAWSPLRLITTVKTNPLTGSCEFRHLKLTDTFTIQAFDPEGVYDPIYLAGISPTPMSP